MDFVLNASNCHDGTCEFLFFSWTYCVWRPQSQNIRLAFPLLSSHQCSRRKGRGREGEWVREDRGSEEDVASGIARPEIGAPPRKYRSIELGRRILRWWLVFFNFHLHPLRGSPTFPGILVNRETSSTWGAEDAETESCLQWRWGQRGWRRYARNERSCQLKGRSSRPTT